MTQKSSFNPLGRGLSRRQFIASSAAGSAALALGGRRAFAQSGDSLKIGFISPRTGPLAGFGQTDGYVLDVARKALADGIELGGKKFSVEILDQDTQSDPSRAGQLAKDLINNQAIDLMLAVSTPETINPVADACEAAGVPCLSTVMPWEAWYFGRGAKPGEPSPFKWTYHFGFGVERVLQGLHLAVEADRDQQEGRRHVSQRRRRQRHPRPPRAAARQGRLHHRRSGRLRDRHRRLFLADRHVQAGRRRDLQLLPDPAGFRGVLAAGGAAGADQADQDRADRQDRPVPVRHRGARRPRQEHRQRRLLAQGVPLQVDADRGQRRRSSPTATRRRAASSGRSSSAPPCRCSTPASRR